MFEDTKGIIRIRISKKNRQHNGQKKNYKRTNNNLQNALLCKLQKGALDSQPQVIKFIGCLPMVVGSLRGLRLLPPLKLVGMI
jgi:hypothetical protein